MLKKELETAKELVAKAGNILLEHYQENPSVSWKGIDAPVTAADRAASELLVRELKRIFPGDGILSEEEQVVRRASADRVSGSLIRWTAKRVMESSRRIRSDGRAGG